MLLFKAMKVVSRFLFFGLMFRCAEARSILGEAVIIYKLRAFGAFADECSKVLVARIGGAMPAKVEEEFFPILGRKIERHEIIVALRQCSAYGRGCNSDVWHALFIVWKCNVLFVRS